MKGRTPMVSREQALARRRWYVVDAKDQVLGRLATKVAGLLRGKGKPDFTPHVDCGDFVVVINAAHVRLTGKKWTQKVYYRHTGYPGGIRSVTPEKLIRTRPEQLVRNAVEGMLPKNRLGRQLARKLKVYAGATHPHEAQQPAPA